MVQPINVFWDEHVLDDTVRDLLERTRLPEGPSLVISSDSCGFAVQLSTPSQESRTWWLLVMMMMMVMQHVVNGPSSSQAAGDLALSLKPESLKTSGTKPYDQKLPQGNSSEALRLLREAWIEHDIASALAATCTCVRVHEFAKVLLFSAFCSNLKPW